MTDKVKIHFQVLLRSTVSAIVKAINTLDDDHYIIADSFSAMACFFYQYVKSRKWKECLAFMKAIAEECKFDFDIYQEDIYAILEIKKQGESFKILLPGLLKANSD